MKPWGAGGGRLVVSCAYCGQHAASKLRSKDGAALIARYEAHPPGEPNEKTGYRESFCVRQEGGLKVAFFLQCGAFGISFSDKVFCATPTTQRMKVRKLADKRENARSNPNTAYLQPRLNIGIE
jgi:hypothetical protein